jgi:Spy/CpxP family protein refolding chaperone
MFSKKRILLASLVMAILVAGATVAFAGQNSRNPLGKLNLTGEQLNALKGVIQEFNAKQLSILTEINNKAIELGLELIREGRFENKGKARKSVNKANKLVKDISSLYGQLLKATAEYVLRTKDALTEEQKEQLISSLLEFEVEVPDELTHDYLIFEFPDSELDLSKKQIKQILSYRTDMQIKQLKLELEIDYKILDLEAEIAKDEVDSQKVNKIVMGIADLWAKLIDNTVNHYLKGKDVLTVAQKEKLLNLMLLRP